MVIGGLQKLSLVDYPGKIAAVVFTQGCAFRCPYCHNPELIAIKKEGALSMRKVLQVLRVQKEFLEGVCITGGEPTLQHDLPVFIKKIKSLGLLVKLDTNGVNPQMVQELFAAKLVDYIAMDIKHAWGKYQLVARTENKNAIENCKKTFVLIQSSGIDHEFRTTVFPEEHTEKDFFDIVMELRSGEKYFLQNIEYIKNLDENIDQTKHLDVLAVTKKLQDAFPHIAIASR